MTVLKTALALRPVCVIAVMPDRTPISGKIGAIDAGADLVVDADVNAVFLAKASIALIRRRSDGKENGPETPCVRQPNFSLRGMLLECECGAVLRLSAADVEVMTPLLEKPNEVVAWSALAAAANRKDYMPDDRMIEMRLRRLRAKIEKAALRCCELRTVRGRGVILETRS
jgi:DNA-binding response OmpR family regulator